MNIDESKRRLSVAIGWQTRAVVINRVLTDEGPQTIRGLMDGGMSLRSIAAATGLSPTYMSRVLNGHTRISLSSYVKLLQIEVERCQRK